MTDIQRDIRISPSESITLREALARYKLQQRGPEYRRIRIVERIIPAHAPYDLSLYHTDWAIISRALHAGITARPDAPDLARRAGSLYARMRRRIHFPASAKQPIPVRMRTVVVAVPGGVITRREDDVATQPKRNRYRRRDGQ